jgi:tetratricopeptide (TPR) repeat protein
MNNNNFNSNDASLSVDLSEATQAVKENRFEDALNLFEIILKENPDNIDSLYLASVSSRYLKKFDESKKYIERLLLNAPDMGRAYQELGHINRDMGNEEKAVVNSTNILLKIRIGRQLIMPINRLKNSNRFHHPYFTLIKFLMREDWD